MSVQIVISTMHISATKILPAPLNPAPVAPPGVEGPVSTVLNWMMWGGLAAVILGFIIAGIALAIANSRGEGHENVKKIGYVIGGAVLIASAGMLGNWLVK